jgi:oligosaccharyltransferase complex subunit alpha (ribophorin I)
MYLVLHLIYRNIKVHTPFETDSELITSHFTYFDSTGRTMVVLEKSNVVKEHELPIQVNMSIYILVCT